MNETVTLTVTYTDMSDGTDPELVRAAVEQLLRTEDTSSVEVTVVPEGVHRFLDLSTGHLPKEEMLLITASPKRVIKHEFGAWAYVPSDDSEADFEDVDWDAYPALKAVLMYARTLDDIWWINFDQDAATIDALPTWDW